MTLLLALAAPCYAEGAKAYRGHLVIAPEVEIFRPCGAKDDLWLDYDHSAGETLASTHRSLVKDAYGESFVVLLGTPGPKLNCGFCEAYKGSFKIERVVEHRASSVDDCPK